MYRKVGECMLLRTTVSVRRHSHPVRPSHPVHQQIVPAPLLGRRSVIRLQKPAAIAAEGDGPCKFYREGHRWVLGDTYHEPRKLYLWDLYRSDVFTVNILGTADWPGPTHTLATLNPHWSLDGMLRAHCLHSLCL